MNATQFLSLIKGVKRRGDGWDACCPAHDDTRASLSVKEGEDGRVLINCHAGCTAQSIVDALGLTLKDLFPQNAKRKSKRRIVATYDYVDEEGTLLFQTVRYEPKDFKQRRPDPAKSVNGFGISKAYDAFSIGCRN